MTADRAAVELAVPTMLATPAMGAAPVDMTVPPQGGGTKRANDQSAHSDST